MTAPSDNLLTNQATVVVTGKVAAGTEVTINDTIVTPDASGDYSYELALKDGTNTITVKAGTTIVTRTVTQDTTGALLTISSPKEGDNLSGTQVTITGLVEVGASLKINGAMVYPDGSGNFSKAITVNLGQNTIKVIATDTAGNVTEKNISVIAPYVTVTVPADNLLTNQATVVVTGKVAVGTELTINNASVTPDASDNYSYELALQDGTNTITVKAGTTIITRTVTQDTTGAPLTISSPKEGDNLSGTQVTVTGMVEVGASLKINGAMVYPDGSGNFSKAITVNLGQNTIKVIATDAAGNVTEKNISVIAPYVTVTVPADNLLTNQGTVVVTGKVAVGTELTINDTVVIPDASGNYSYTYTLADGTNTITVVAGSTTVTRMVTKDTNGPDLVISSPKEGENLSGTQVTVSGTVTVEVGASVKINGVMVYPDGSGNFSKAITVNLGQNTIKVIATDAAGNVTEKNITVIAPYVTVTAPADNLLTNQGTVVVTGKVAMGTALTINDIVVTPDASGNYSYELTLQDGTNTITVVAGTTTVLRTVTQDTTAPSLVVSSPAEDTTVSLAQITITGQSEVGSIIKVNNVRVYPDVNGNFVKTISLVTGTNIITVTATDAAGNVTTVTRNITYTI
ncbi:hypothetical protein [Desulfitobacterium metallireducens]|uniref:Uncharacterized protein n=1 Tax=Desulfitobacterium metallireducens DSM 15288 TaxID=871968 RepID=W0EGE9_9FIRM|nr:hypothetical protein [Desulfitobacterium metallireducens]AHF08593.1 hypothetical protein DESME_09140 [Desulfitobacterium metallireducens DSM 15288]